MGATFDFTLDESDTISLSEWLNDSSLDPKSLWNRKAIVRLMEKANGDKMDDIIQGIKEGKASLYAISKNFMDGIRKTHSPYTVYMYRSLLPSMWESLLSEYRFSEKKFDRLVPNGAAYITHVKAVPERAQVVEMLKIASPLYRALIGFLACTGMRIGEALSRKWSDLEIRTEGYARIELKAKDTKARYDRSTFVTRECVEWLKAVRTKNDSLFPSSYSEHLSYNSALTGVKILFSKVGLVSKADKSQIYTLHSFRTFAGDQLRECGLLEKYTLAVIGHKNKTLGSEISYLDWRKIESDWKEKCALKMTFVDRSVVMQPKIEQLERTNGKLEALLERLLERLPPTTNEEW